MSFNLEEIKNSFNKVISYSQNIDSPNSDRLFKDWLNAKRDYIEAFQGKLIYTWPEKISFELSKEAKEKNYKDFLYEVDSILTYRHTNNAEWVDIFIDFLKELDLNDFYSNKLSKDYKIMNIIVPKGIKTIKAFKYFFPKDEENTLKFWQDAASRLIQKNKISGYLCLSVHPLDFLSTSETGHNWRSCHSLDGEYRTGNLAYMVDKSSVVCYLRSDEDIILPNFPSDVPWNSKKWRVLLNFSNDWTMVFAGKQYPFSSDEALKFLTERVLPAAALGFYGNFYNDQITYYQFPSDSNMIFLNQPYIITSNKKFTPISEVIKEYTPNFGRKLFFCDLLHSSTYIPKYAYKVESIFNEDFIFKTGKNPMVEVGAPVYCLKCGEYEILTPGTVYCPTCYDKYEKERITCENCGRAILEEDAFWSDVYEEWICYSCQDEMYECEDCGELFFAEDIVEDNGGHIRCKDCHEERRIEKIAREEGNIIF